MEISIEATLCTFTAGPRCSVYSTHLSIQLYNHYVLTCKRADTMREKKSLVMLSCPVVSANCTCKLVYVDSTVCLDICRELRPVTIVTHLSYFLSLGLGGGQSQHENNFIMLQDEDHHRSRYHT